MSFKNLMDAHLNFLATNPINEELGVDFSEILKDAAKAQPGAYGGAAKKESSSEGFGSFAGDPQGREESTLGGGGGSGMGDSTLGGASSGSVASDSSVYTKNLGGGSFVDPFKSVGN
jgi:cell division initiation protein